MDTARGSCLNTCPSKDGGKDSYKNQEHRGWAYQQDARGISREATQLELQAQQCTRRQLLTITALR